MNSKDNLEKLESSRNAAWDAYTVACDTNDDTAKSNTLENYRIARNAVMNARIAHQVKEMGINKMTNTNTNNIMIPRFITLSPIDEEFEAKFNTMDIIDYASNGKNCVVHLFQGSSIKTIIVEESVQDIMELIGDK